jgi:HPt (histidine-containing phosphotransfer) domain-containing protein
MSLQSRVGDITRGVQDTINEALNQADSLFENIIGNATTALNNIWDGGFAGMSADGMESLKTALENYCKNIEAQIASFNEQGNLEIALKGEAQAAAVDFVGAVKQLLQAYVSRMRQEISEADEAYNNWIAASKGLASDVRSDADDIRSNAASVRLD